MLFVPAGLCHSRQVLLNQVDDLTSIHERFPALQFRHPDDPESLKLGRLIEHDGLKPTLSRIAGLDPDDPLLDEVALP